MFEDIDYTVTDRVATITLSRPDALNALTDRLYAELGQALQTASQDSDVGAIVLTGAGRAFCAGADVKAMNPDMALLDRRKRHRGILRDVVLPLVNVEKPTIAAVNGPAVGAGFSLALACDFIVASEQAMFSLLFKRLGLVPDLGALYLLSRVVPLPVAKELCFTAKKISGDEAKALGIVNHVLPHDTLMSEVMTMASDIAQGPATALAMMKGLLDKSANATLEQMLEYESYAQTLAYTTADHREGVAAFREKRAPRFKGK